MDDLSGCDVHRCVTFRTRRMMPRMTADEDRLAGMFRHFAVKEFAGASPLYERFSGILADRADLAAPLLVSPTGQRRALLYFAAIAYLLRTSAIGHPLTDWYPCLGGTRTPDEGDPGAVLADLVRSHVAELTTICATRTTQTNEANRAALLRPCFGTVSARFDGRALALVELGTSAGLLLVPDRYSYRYHGGGRSEVFEPASGEPGLRLDCEVIGDGRPTTAGIALDIASRTGIDLSPIRPGDTDGVNWLRSCVWPEHTARLDRLDAALALVAVSTPRLIAGDFRTELPIILSTVESDAIPCVFASHALTYLGVAERDDIIGLLDAVGSSRDLALILNEAAACGAHLVAPDVPTPAGLATPVTVVTWRNGTASVEVPAVGGPHGAWLDCQPRGYAYRPCPQVPSSSTG